MCCRDPTVVKRFTRQDISTSVSKRWACVLSEWDFCSSGKDMQPGSTPLNAAPKEHFLGRGRRLLRSQGSQEYSAAGTRYMQKEQRGLC